MKNIIEETIKKDIEKMNTPITTRIAVYGYFLCGSFFALSAYINSNPLHKSEALFWLPIEAIGLVTLFSIISFIMEKAYKNINNNLSKENIVFLNTMKDFEISSKEFRKKYPKFVKEFNELFENLLNKIPH